jgi:MFS family permease
MLNLADLHTIHSQRSILIGSTTLQAFASLIAAYLVSMKVNRVRIVGMGTLLCGITAAGVALSFRYGYMMIWRAIDGLSPALVVPAVQSIIAGQSLQRYFLEQ